MFKEKSESSEDNITATPIETKVSAVDSTGADIAGVSLVEQRTQAVAFRSSGQSEIINQNPAVLIQRMRNMGLINNAEKEKLLALPPDQQQQIVQDTYAKAEQMRLQAQEASRNGIISHSEFMALYHCANGIKGADGIAAQYSLDERIVRAEELALLSVKVKDSSLTLEAAQAQYRDGATLEARKMRSESDKTAGASPGDSSHSDASMGSGRKTGSLKFPYNELSIYNIRSMEFIPIVHGNAYDIFMPGIRTEDVPASSSYRIPKQSVTLEAFKNDVLEAVLADTSFESLKGRTFALHFHPDLNAAYTATTGKSLGENEHVHGFTNYRYFDADKNEVLNPTEEERKNLEEAVDFFFDPKDLSNRAVAIGNLHHELTHVALRSEGFKGTQAEAELEVIRRTNVFLEAYADKTTDEAFRTQLQKFVGDEKKRAENLPARYDRKNP